MSRGKEFDTSVPEAATASGDGRGQSLIVWRSQACRGPASISYLMGHTRALPGPTADGDAPGGMGPRCDGRQV